MSPFLHRVLLGRVPLLHGSYGTLRRLAVLPAALRFLRLAVPPKRPGFAPWSEGRIAPGLGFGERSPDRISSVETSRPPKGSWENPYTHMPCSQTPVGPRRLAIRTSRYCLPLLQQRRPSRSVHFRGSIARPACFLCTLRSHELPGVHATLGSGGWPALAGQEWLPAGFSAQGFRPYIAFLPAQV